MSILLCYDGSETAANAIRVAATTLGGRDAIVLNVWTLPFNFRKPDEEARLHSVEVAEQGAAIARDAGFTVTDVVEKYASSLWPAIVDHAEMLGVDCVVVGTHGTTVLGTVLGSVAYGVAHHCTRPVLIVRPEPAS